MEHHSSDHESPKRIYFGAPIIMGLSFWIITFFFLSMCDGPKACYAEGGKECCTEQGECKKDGEHKEADSEVKTVTVDSVANAFSETPADTLKTEGKKEEPSKEEAGEKK